MERRLREQCALCGNPAVDGWHCVAHTWASKPATRPAPRNGEMALGPLHAYWIERLTPRQAFDIAGYLEPMK